MSTHRDDHDHGHDLLVDVDLVDELDGTTLTHRLTADERAAGMVVFSPDLLPFKDLDAVVEVELEEGGVLDHEHLGTTSCAWAGPAGWLDGFGAGDLLGLVVEDGVLHVTTVEGDLATEPDAVGQCFERLHRDQEDQPVPLVDLAREVAGMEAGASLPRAPFGERVAAAGFEVHEDHVAGAGFDWSGWERRTKVRRLVGAYGLGAPDADRALDVLALVDAPDATPEALADAADQLVQPAFAQLVADDLLGPDGPEGVGEFAARLAEHATNDPARATARWLGARVLERDGDVLGAERELGAVVALAPRFAPALEDLATFTGDRGDAKRTLDLLLRAGAGNREPAVLELRDMVARTGSRAGRNDPCPCGSGKKFKACHWGQEEIPIERRVGWLWNKAASYAQRGPSALALLDIARAYAGPVATNRAVIDLAFGDGVVVDLQLHEGGAFERFLERRGVLLPEDEGALAQTWLGTRRAVYEVEAILRNEGVVLVEQLTGARAVVVDRMASRTATAGEHVATRLVPDGTGEQQMVGGGVVIRPDACHDLATALGQGHDAVATAALLGEAGRR